MPYFRIDLETFSELDLKKVGVDVYANHESTEILLVPYSINGKPAKLWDVTKDPIPEELLAAIKNPYWRAYHFGSFDPAVWNVVAPKKLGLPAIAPHRWRDIQAMALLAGAPASLKNVCIMLDIDADLAKLDGDKGIELFSKLDSRKKTRRRPEDYPDEWKQFCEYAIRDVDVFKPILAKISKLPLHEEVLFQASCKMNQNGLPLDWVAVNAFFERYSKVLMPRAAKYVYDNTGGVLASSPPKMLGWLNDQLGHKERYTSLSVADDVIADPATPQLIKDVLLARSVVTSAAVKKSASMLLKSIPVSATLARSRHAFRFCGAPGSQRWSGQGIQPQNFARPEIDHDQAKINAYIEAVKAGTLAEPLSVAELVAEVNLMSSGMRGLIWHPDGIVSSDYSAIELRVLAALVTRFMDLAGTKPAPDADLLGKLLSGQDLYIHMGVIAAKALGVEGITPENAKATGWRQTGKMIMLALQYGMGHLKFMSQVTLPGKAVSEEDAQKLVQVYRATYPQVKAFWTWLERSFTQVAKHGGSVGISGLFTYTKEGNHVVLLKPSGTKLYYRDVEIKDKIYHRAVTDNGIIVTQSIWGGDLTAHLVSSISRDITANALCNAARAGLELVSTIHDELVIVGGKAQADVLHACMLDIPDWAQGWAIAAETTVGERWGK